MKFSDRIFIFKSFRIFATVCLIGLTVLFGCQKEGDTPTNVVDTSTEDAIADLVAGVLGNTQSTNGLTAQIAGAARIASGDTLGKMAVRDYVMAIPDDSTFVVTKAKTTGDFTYTLTYNYHYAFDSAHRDSLVFDYSCVGVYSFDRMFGSFNDNCTFTVAGIKGLATYQLNNGIYNRIIADTLKVRDHRALSGSIMIEFSQITVSKTSHSVLAGNVSITVSLDTPDGDSKDYDATLAFIPVDQATLVVNGRSYNINCITAHATYITP
jgi:hypothetical protein